MTCVKVTEVISQTSFSVRAGDSLLKGMEKAGISIVGVGCRGGGCGLCKIHVLGGEFETGKMSSRHVSDEDKKVGHILACRCYPATDVEFKLIEK